MRIAYVLFDGVTLLDFVGVYDPVSRLRTLGYLPNLHWDLCGVQPSIRDSFGLEITTDRAGESLAGYDLVFVPGGLGTRTLRHDAAFVNWLKTAEPVPRKVSVCTGALLLGAAGFLVKRRATTHFNEYATLAPYCREVVRERIVDDGGVITAGAVASSLDLGLHLVGLLGGEVAVEPVKRGMDYLND